MRMGGRVCLQSRGRRDDGEGELSCRCLRGCMKAPASHRPRGREVTVLCKCPLITLAEGQPRAPCSCHRRHMKTTFKGSGTQTSASSEVRRKKSGPPGTLQGSHPARWLSEEAISHLRQAILEATRAVA